MTELNEEKLLGLLCKKATDCLDGREMRELESLENAFPAWKGDVSYETAATAINLAAVEPGVKMPDHLKTAIAASAEEFFGSASAVTIRPWQESRNDARIASSGKEYGEQV